MKGKDQLVVDGYNLIYAWPELNQLKDDLEYARHQLAEWLANYGTYKGYQVTIVYDAQHTEGKTSLMSPYKNLQIVFTAENETADSFIEKYAYQKVRENYRVYVVTGDYAEQLTILGVGAYRISARECYKDIKKAQQAIAGKLAVTDTISVRNELEGRLKAEIIEKLQVLRRKR